MLYKGHHIELKRLKIDDIDFSGYNVGDAKFAFVLAPSTKNTTCVFQVLCSFDSDCENGNTIEFEGHVLNFFDNEGREPMLMELIYLARKSEQYLSDLFHENMPSLSEIPKTVIRIPDEDKMVDLIVEQLQQVYPRK